MANRINLPVLYNQGDTRWAKKKLGFNTNEIYNFANYACLICCLAAIARYFGFNVNPIDINDKLMALGAGNGFTAGSGNYVWGAITKIISEIKERVITTPMPLTNGQLGEIRTALDNGYPVMVLLDYDPKDTDLDSHFVVLVDYDPSDENNFTIYDPLGGVYRSLKHYLGWFRPSVRNTIEKYIIFTGPKPQQGGNTVAVDADVFPNLVHGSGEHDKTVAEYLPGNDPTQTNFEDIQRVVNGYKSDATNAKNKANDLEKKLEISQTEIKNSEQRLAEEKAKCQRELELKNAEIITLKQSQPNIDKIKGEYEGTIKALEKDLTTAQEQIKTKNTKIAGLESDLKHAQDSQETVSAIEKVIQFIKSIWQKNGK